MIEKEVYLDALNKWLEGMDYNAEELRSNGTTKCPLCGVDTMHGHSPLEIIIYRNGVKFGRSL